MSSFRKAAGLVSMALALVGVLAVLAAAWLNHEADEVGMAAEASGAERVVEQSIACPFPTDYSISPSYTWSVQGGVLYLTVDPPAATGEPWDSIDRTETTPAESDKFQIFYNFSLSVGTSFPPDYLFEPSIAAWWPSRDSMTLSTTKRLGADPGNAHYNLRLVVNYNGTRVCEKYVGHRQNIVGDALDYLQATPVPTITPESTATSTPTPSPTSTPGCSSYSGPSQDAIDAHDVLVTPYQSRGKWRLQVGWRPLADVAMYRVSGVGYGPRIAQGEGYLGSDTCDAPSRWRVDGQDGRGSDLPGECGILQGLEPVLVRDQDHRLQVRGEAAYLPGCTRGYRGDSVGRVEGSDLRPKLRFRLVDWADSYVVRMGSDDKQEITPSSSQIAAGEVVVRGSLISSSGLSNYDAEIQAVSSGCLGVPIDIECDGDCDKLDPDEPSPTLTPPDTPCSSYGMPVLELTATEREDGRYDVEVEVVSPEAGPTHYDVSVTYDGGTAATTRYTKAELSAGVSLGVYSGPDNSGEYKLLMAQATAVNDDESCEGAQGPLSVERLVYTSDPGGTPTPTPIPTSTPGNPLAPPGSTVTPTPQGWQPYGYPYGAAVGNGDADADGLGSHGHAYGAAGFHGNADADGLGSHGHSHGAAGFHGNADADGLGSHRDAAAHGAAGFHGYADADELDPHADPYGAAGLHGNADADELGSHGYPHGAAWVHRHADADGMEPHADAHGSAGRHGHADAHAVAGIHGNADADPDHAMGHVGADAHVDERWVSAGDASRSRRSGGDPAPGGLHALEHANGERHSARSLPVVPRWTVRRQDGRLLRAGEPVRQGLRDDAQDGRRRPDYG